MKDGGPRLTRCVYRLFFSSSPGAARPSASSATRRASFTRSSPSPAGSIPRAPSSASTHSRYRPAPHSSSPLARSRAARSARSLAEATDDAAGRVATASGPISPGMATSSRCPPRGPGPAFPHSSSKSTVASTPASPPSFASRLDSREIRQRTTSYDNPASFAIAL
jgi:hypothetical protein